MKRIASHLLIAAAVTAAYLFGAFAPLERDITSLRFRLLPEKASGDVVIVGIDTQSLKQLDVWPWPREYHAALVDKLVAAGASRIALDIDFSSHSSARSDAAFAAALARAGDRIVLATFKQPAIDKDGKQIFVYTAPIARFARYGRLGHVNVRVEGDSLVWRYDTFEKVGEFDLPGMATLLARASYQGSRSFTIDYGIRPETIPYVSYADVLSGRIDPAIFAGKTVIVGATALELGDRIPVPLHHVLAGPVVQAIIAETLRQGRGLNPMNPYVVALLTVVVGGGLGWLIARSSWKRGALIMLALLGGLFGVSLALQAKTTVLFDFSPIFVAPLAIYLLNLTRSIDRLAGAFRRERFESLYRRAMMDSVVDSGFDGIAIADSEGNVELVNPSAARLMGSSPSELTGTPIHAVLPWSPEIEALYQTDEGRETANVVGPLELVLSRPAGDLTIELVVSTARLSLQNGKGSAAEKRIVHIYTFRDISDRKRTEEAQRRAVEEAEAASRAKTEFLHNMSHELRTPLNAIIGFSDVVRNEMMGPVGVPQYLDYIKDINESGQHLLGVVNDILDMSKIESGEMQLNETELFLQQTVQSSQRMIDERATAAGLSLVVEVPRDLPEVLADDRMVKQMLLNLLGNAVKFTPEGGTITIGAGVDADGSMALWVRDTGIGIDSKDFEKILEPFGQADASLSREYEGTGLGLPLVKSMIELHDGRLEIESTVGEGSTFLLRFPEARVCAPIKPAGEAAPSRAVA